MPEKKGLDIESLKEVIRILKENDLSEICIEQNNLKIQVKQGQSQPVHSIYSVPIQTVQEKETLPLSKTEVSNDNSVFITAPCPGTFYGSPQPGEKPFVNVGDSVKAGQILCIIEAMKLLNDITADMDCDILEVMVKNGESVEYDTKLFRVKPKA